MITVIVPTYRRVMDLAKCLDGIEKQTRPADEVIIIVRNIDTETLSHLQTNTYNSLPLRILLVSQQGQVFALNAGLEICNGDIIAITDDDTIPRTDWLERIEQTFLKDDHIGAVGGRDWVYKNGVLLDEKKKKVGKVQWFGRLIGNHHLGVGKAREVDFLKGANMSYRRNAIKDIRFNKKLKGTGAQVHNDLDFSLQVKKSGWKIIYDPHIVVDHYPSQRFDNDQRNTFNKVAQYNAAYNETYVLISYLNYFKILFFVIWTILMGTQSSPGCIQWIRMLLQTNRSHTNAKLFATMHGRWDVFKIWMTPKFFQVVVSLFRRKDSAGAVLNVSLTNAFILILNLLTGLITARYLGPIGRGDQAAMVMWPQFFSHIFTLGLPSAIIYYMKKRPKDTGKIYFISLIMSMILGLIPIIPAIIFIPNWMDGFSHGTILFAQIAMLTTPIGLIGLINNSVLQVRGEYGLLNRIRFLVPITTFGLLLIFLLSNSLTPLSSSISYMIPLIPLTGWLTLRLFKIYKPKFRYVNSIYKSLIQYGIKSYGNDIAGTVSVYIDKVILVSVLTARDLGLYIVVFNLSRMLNVFQTAVNMVLFPTASGLSQDKAISLTIRMFKVSLIVNAVMVIGIFIIAPYVVTIFYGKEYAASINLFRILLLQIVISNSGWGLTQGFMAVGRPGLVTLLQSVDVALNIPLLLILISFYTLNGAGLALLITSVFRLIVIISLYRYALKVKLNRLMFTQDDFKWMKRMIMKPKVLNSKSV